MKQTYTIGEIATMLRIGVDAIRFYEKKGLVHPKKDEKNKYRMFSMYNILELLDVIYYRELDIPISDIVSILQTGRKENMRELLEEKRKKAEQRIRFERQLIKKIEYIEGAYETIESHQGVKVKEFPKAWILTRGSEKEEIMKSQIVDLTKDQFVMSHLYSTYNMQSGNMQDLYITMEQSIMKEFGISWKKCTPLNLGLCIYTVVQLSDMTLQKEDIKKILIFAKEHHMVCDDIVYIHEIPLTTYTDETNYFAEIYLPIKNQDFA